MACYWGLGKRQKAKGNKKLVIIRQIRVIRVPFVGDWGLGIGDWGDFRTPKSKLKT
jgi:hypothetical protein